MTLAELKAEVNKYQYFEDNSVVDTVLAATIASHLGAADPIWLIVIGPSAGGKSQIIRPISLADPEFIHRIDDLTENTFLSGKTGKGNEEISLLNTIGPRGIIAISDFSVIFSKAAEVKSAILSQFRMIYDGEMTKYSGAKKEPIRWKGKLSMIAGATPSIYRTFEEHADMGERFIHFRMKDNDSARIGMRRYARHKGATDVDLVLKSVYRAYLEPIIRHDWLRPAEVKEDEATAIVEAAVFAEQARAPAVFDWRGNMIEAPVPATSGRVTGQLLSLAEGFIRMNEIEGGIGLRSSDLKLLRWCAYSLINERKRKCLRVLGSVEYGSSCRTQTIADKVGYGTEIVNTILQTMAATGILTRDADGNGFTWKLARKKDWEYVREMEEIFTTEHYTERGLSMDEGLEREMVAEEEWKTLQIKS